MSLPIPGVIETLASLRAQGIRIGSTTGYTRAMMDVVVPGAAAKGYTVDNCVTPDGLPKGRPFPYMIQKNMADLGITDTDTVLKYGDTIADIKEGINAKVWTVGVVMGSNEMGLTQEEAACMTRAELEYRKTQVRRRMLEAGAHYVVDTIAELPDVIDDINSKLEEHADASTSKVSTGSADACRAFGCESASVACFLTGLACLFMRNYISNIRLFIPLICSFIK